MSEVRLVHLCRCWDDKMLSDAMSLLVEEFPLPSDVPGGMPEYRISLTLSFFFKFFWTVKSLMPGIIHDTHSLVLPSSFKPLVVKL